MKLTPPQAVGVFKRLPIKRRTTLLKWIWTMFWVMFWLAIASVILDIITHTKFITPYWQLKATVHNIYWGFCGATLWWAITRKGEMT